MKKFTKEDANRELERGYKDAVILLNDEDKMERFLQRLEKKLRVIPLAGDALASLPVLVSLFRAYAKKEYRDLPIGSIVAITSALVYFLSPIDVIPDIIPGIGHIDDALVITACLKLVQSDVDEYIVWRQNNRKEMDL